MLPRRSSTFDENGASWERGRPAPPRALRESRDSGAAPESGRDVRVLRIFKGAHLRKSFHTPMMLYPQST
jgi:hypothetical protein